MTKITQKEIERLGKLGFDGRKALPDGHPGFVMVGDVKVILGDHPKGEEYLFQTSGEGWRHAPVSEFEPTIRKAAALAKSIGPGWTGYVHQNLGWHYRATSACRRVDITGSDGYYTAFLRPPSDTHQSGGTYCAHADTPDEAILICERLALADFKLAQSMIATPIERNRPKPPAKNKRVSKKRKAA